MADFDWDAQEGADAKDFDWGSQENAEKSSQLETGIMHGLQGATAGFLDELSGAGEAAGRVVGVEGLGGSFSDVGLAKGGPTLRMDVLKKAYENSRDRKRAMLATQAKDNPGTAATANFVGMVGSPVNKLAKGLSLAKGGALLGGINSLGASDADTASGVLTDTAIGTGTGLVLGKSIEKASPLISAGLDKASKGARSLATKMAARALGAERGTIKSIGADKVFKAGAQALDEGVLSPFAATDDLIARNQATKDAGGKLMGKAYDAIDEAGASTFSPLKVAEEVDDTLGNFYRSPINKGETRQLENTIESIMMRNADDASAIPLREAQLLKEELQKVANWKNKLNVTDKERMARDAYGIVSRNIDDAVEQGGEAVNQAGLGETLKQGKSLFSNASTAGQLLENKFAREQGNNLLGLTDAITGAGALGYGASTDDWGTAGAIMLGKKGLQKYGSQNSALALNKVSKMLMRSPRLAELATKNPNAFNSLAQSIAERASQALPKAASFDPTKPGDDKDARDAFLEY